MKTIKNAYLLKIIFSAFILLYIFSPGLMAQRKMEKLDRGLVAVQTGNGVFLSWRVFGTDPKSIAFNIYRNGTKVNSSPISGATNMVDASGSSSATYTVRPVLGGVEQAVGATASVWGSQARTITLSNRPSSNHAPNDINIGDLDGDGKYDLVVKWYPANAKDNSQSGVTDNTFLAAYKLDGTFMWIIDLGRNIRSGAHYTQHLVGDYDSDGLAEVVCKTAPGTRDGTGAYLSRGPAASDNDGADYRNSGGYILSGPEYVTIFNGKTGSEMATINYDVPRGNVGSWGDTYGNRVDRFNATNAYLDGVKPSMILQRGYYTRMVIAAYDWNGQTLSRRWLFDSNNSGSGAAHGNGNHSIMATDIDADGFDEILTGSACIDHDGKFKWATGYGHGDANHVGDFDPASPGLEVWQVSENRGSEPDHYMIRASDGRVLWRNGSGNDNGRGMVGDIDARYPGQEAWSSSVGGTFDARGNSISTNKPASTNFRVYWDGDLQDELLNNNVIDKWNGNGSSRVLNLTGNSCNGTKATPNLSADILGDWREEVILHDGASRLYIHTTTIPTQHKLYTLMHDPVYRNAISWQQSSYNQPPHLGFWLGAGVDNAPTPNIVLVGSEEPANQFPTASITAPANNASFVALASIAISATAADADGSVSSVAFYNGTTLLGTDNTSPYSFTWNNVAAGTYTLTVRATDNEGAVTTSAARTVTVTTPPSGFTLQAETACTADGIPEESTNAGFNGSGYVNLDNATGTSASWVVNSASNQTVNLNIRYANGSTNNRNMSLQVNGTAQVSSIDFLSTGAWTTWNTTTVSVNLVSGRNTLLLTSLMGEGGPNIDELGFSSTTVTAAACTVANQPPLVSLTSPANNASFTAPASITLTANASDSDGMISNVQFYNGTTLLGSDATSPYSFTWNNVAAGSYTITASATDNSGAVTTSSAVAVTVTQEAPSGVTLQGEAACAADGILNESVNEGYNGTGYVNLDNAIGTTVSWVINASAAQSVSLNIRYANGSANNRNMSIRVNGTIQVSNIDFPGTGAWTTWNTATALVSLSAGNNTIVLTSLMGEGAPNIDELTFGSSTVSAGTCSVPNQSPTVSISGPADNESFTAPASIVITANAVDTDGSVSTVQFYNGSTLLGSDATSPYSFTWNNVAAGTYTLTARATDNNGAVTTSTAVTVTVTTPPVSTADIIGPDCGSVNSTIMYEVNPANRTGATAYSWWFSGSTQSITPVSGSPYRVNIQTGPYFTGGQVCVGVTYNVAPYHTSFCINVDRCAVPTATRMSAGIAEQASILPNPTEGAFALTVQETVQSVIVTDMYGIEVFAHGGIQSGENIRFGDNLANGIYTITIVYTSGRIESKKVQKVQ